MNKHSLLKLLPIAILDLIPTGTDAKEVARFSMENSGNAVTEVISGKTFEINGVHEAENVAGARGKALRFDGYSTYIDGELGDLLPDDATKLTASVWLAVETYPIVEIDVNTSELVAIVSCLDESAKTGFGFFIGFDGKYSFKTYVGGWPLELKVDEPLAQYEWINLTAVIDTEARSATLYKNGAKVASSKANGKLKAGNCAMRIGRSFNERFAGPFCLTSFNGVIDDITVWDEALSEETIAAWGPENDAELATPSSRFADDQLRPTFHGMPGANWTNETHGMTYSNGRFHLFFQKNANGPYMSRLHWGHLSSENLYDWTEEQIALTPGEEYDIKGCWSGCVFTDDELTESKPSIIYTAVDYAKAVIAQAYPADDDLISWDKAAQPIINGRPTGLSDDFRDPYFFRTANGAYIIVGSSKGGVGTTTLHAYNPETKRWSNDGKTFFTGSDASTCGTFWEMPNITPMGDKWLFTATPQNTSKGVAALYWVGQIGADGTFTPDRTSPANIELSGFARDGYGLLSPTIYSHDGKTIALGIVPDKLPSQANYELGYAHTYSLPREWTLDSDGNLCQKPYSGLTAMRAENGFAKTDFTLDGSLTLSGIEGRAVELVGEFTVGAGKCGFTLLDDGASQLKVYYDGATNEIVVDASGLDRLINDAGVFDGYYHSPLPKQLAKGEAVKLNVFFDHSIIDIFVNDKWATSVRVFAKSKTDESVTVFADAPTQLSSVSGWKLNASNSSAGIDAVIADGEDFFINAEAGRINYSIAAPAILTVFDLAGNKVFEKYIDNSKGQFEATLSGLHIVTLHSKSKTISKKIIF